MLELTRIAQEFYTGECQHRNEGFYFFLGEISVHPESVVEINDEEYALLKKYIY